MALTGDYFYDVVVKRDDPEDDPVILDGVEVLVELLEDGVWDDAQIYNNENLSDVHDNPFTTDDSGEIAFWAAQGEYRITIADLEDPVRIDPRVIVWMSIPYGDFNKLRFPGEIVLSGRDTPPEGWLLCDGSAVSRTAYARLFNAIGIWYGPGDGGTTFNLPDLRGRFPMGLGTNIVVQALGESEEAAVGTRSPTHRHGLASHSHAQAHTHTGSVESLTVSTSGTHRHKYAGGHNMHTRRNATETGGEGSFPLKFADVTDLEWEFSLQSLYIEEYNAYSHGGDYDRVVVMDDAGAHSHSVPQGNVGTGQPSTPNTGAPSVDDTGYAVSPFQVVNFFIRV